MSEALRTATGRNVFKYRAVSDRLTVQEKYPQASCRYWYTFGMYRVTVPDQDRTRSLGCGDTATEAWRNAASRVRERIDKCTS